MATNENKINKLLETMLEGKVNFGTIAKDKVFISVDNHFKYNDKIYLLEVDSGNEAKLLAGQYILINVMFNECRNENVKSAGIEKCVFLVIHCYKDYNPERTEKNLNLLKEKFELKLDYKVIHYNDFEDENSFKNLL